MSMLTVSEQERMYRQGSSLNEGYEQYGVPAVANLEWSLDGVASRRRRGDCIGGVRRLLLRARLPALHEDVANVARRGRARTFHRPEHPRHRSRRGRAQPGRVAAIHLRLGPLSGVVKGALLSAYELRGKGLLLSRPS